MAIRRQASIDRYETHVNEQLDDLLTDVRILRDEAKKLRDQLSVYTERADRVAHDDLFAHLGEAGQADVQAKVSQIMDLLHNVTINVSTVRAPEQLRDYNKAMGTLETVRDQLGGATAAADLAKVTQLRDLIATNANATEPEPTGPVNYKYQSVVLGCTKEDQKQLRADWRVLLQQAHRSVERVEAEVAAHVAAPAPPPPLRAPSDSAATAPPTAPPVVSPAVAAAGAAAAARRAAAAASSTPTPTPTPPVAADTQGSGVEADTAPPPPKRQAAQTRPGQVPPQHGRRQMTPEEQFWMQQRRAQAAQRRRQAAAAQRGGGLWPQGYSPHGSTPTDPTEEEVLRERAAHAAAAERANAIADARARRARQRQYGGLPMGRGWGGGGFGDGFWGGGGGGFF